MGDIFLFNLLGRADYGAVDNVEELHNDEDNGLPTGVPNSPEGS